MTEKSFKHPFFLLPGDIQLRILEDAAAQVWVLLIVASKCFHGTFPGNLKSVRPEDWGKKGCYELVWKGESAKLVAKSLCVIYEACHENSYFEWMPAAADCGLVFGSSQTKYAKVLYHVVNLRSPKLQTLEVLQTLLRRMELRSPTDRTFYTACNQALQLASAKGDLHCVRAFLCMSQWWQYYDFVRAGFLAAQNGHLNVLEKLLDHHVLDFPTYGNGVFRFKMMKVGILSCNVNMARGMLRLVVENIKPDVVARYRNRLMRSARETKNPKMITSVRSFLFPKTR